MSGMLAIVGHCAESAMLLRRGAEAAPGRGEVQAFWQNDQAAMMYQGSNAEQEFCLTDHYVCIVSGWPYRLEASSKLSTRLSASDLIRQFAVNHAFDVETIFGQYTIALFCRRQARLHVVRDVFGSLPLHWAQTAWGSVHACDIRQVSAMLAAPLTLSLVALRAYQQELALPPSSDLYIGIHQHAPGTCASFGANAAIASSAILSPATVLRGFSSQAPPPDALDQLIDALANSIDICQGSAKTAISLSGGMDSTLIALSAVTTAKSKVGAAPVGISCVFPGLSCDESVKISKLVTEMQLAHETITCNSPAFAHWQHQLFNATDYVPFPAAHIGLQVAQRAKQVGCEQLLDGNGGDELFDWDARDLAQMATSSSDYFQLIRVLLKPRSGPKALALRHLIKRLLFGRLLTPAPAPLAVCLKMISPSLNRTFYLAAEQVASSAGIALFSPFRDLRILKLLLPWLPNAAFQSGNRRGLQSNAVYKLSGGNIRLKRNEKVNYDEFALVPFDAADSDTLPALGSGKLANFSGLMPKFLKHKIETEGVLYK